MMVAVFAATLLTLAFGWLGYRRIAAVCFAVCFGLSIWLFLFEIYSPDYGFRMPWIQTELEHETPAMQIGTG